MNFNYPSTKYMNSNHKGHQKSVIKRSYRDTRVMKSVDLLMNESQSRKSLPFPSNDPSIIKYFQNVNISQKYMKPNQSQNMLYNSKNNQSFVNNISSVSSNMDTKFMNKTSPLNLLCNDLPISSKKPTRLYKPRSQVKISRTFNDFGDMGLNNSNNRSIRGSLPFCQFLNKGFSIMKEDRPGQNGYSQQNYQKESWSTSDNSYRRIENRVKSKSPNNSRF